MKTKIRNARLAFPAIFTAKAFGEGEPAFSASLIIDPTTPAGKKQHDDLNAAIEAVAEDKWKEKAATTLKTLRAAGKVAYRSGDDKAQYDGFEGNHYLAARSATRPLVIDRDKTPLAEADGKPYGGCFVNATVELWAQDNQYGKRINATLKGVQFARDGDAFSGGGSPADPDDFDDLSEGADADDLV